MVSEKILVQNMSFNIIGKILLEKQKNAVDKDKILGAL